MDLTYVALLRGINVGRAKRVAMADLRALVERLGYHEVRTLLNSGNVVFSGPRASSKAIAERIGTAIGRHLGISARVTVLSAAELAAAAAGNPLLGVAANPSRLLVAFAASPMLRDQLKPLLQQEWAPEAFALGARVAYLWCPEGISASRVAEEVGRVLGDAVTMRNWATVGKLLELSTTGRT